MVIGHMHQRIVDAHTPRTGLRQNFRRPRIAPKKIQCQRFFMCIHIGNHLIQGFIGAQRQNRTENLLTHHRRTPPIHRYHRGFNEFLGAFCPSAQNNLRTLQIFTHSIKRSFIHHSSVIRTPQHIAAIHLFQCHLRCINKCLFLAAMHPHIIRRDARLSGIHRLPPNHPFGRRFHVAALFNDGRTLAAQLQSHWNQPIRRRFGHNLAQKRSARKKDVIPLLLQQPLILINTALNHKYLFP